MRTLETQIKIKEKLPAKTDGWSKKELPEEFKILQISFDGDSSIMFVILKKLEEMANGHAWAIV